MRVKILGTVSSAVLMAVIGAWCVWPSLGGFVSCFAAGWCAALAMVMRDLRGYTVIPLSE